MIQRKAYQDLEVWKEAMNLATNIYRNVMIDQDSNHFDLFTSIRERALQIPINIQLYYCVEDFEAQVDNFEAANSGCAVLDCYFLLCRNLEALPSETIEMLLENTDRVNNSLNEIRLANERVWQEILSGDFD